MRPIIGLDPGQKTGVSVFHGGNGAIQYLLTVSPDQIDALIIEHMPRLLVFEDSRRQSAVFGRGVNPRAMLKIARNVGEVDQICRQICETCRRLEINIIAVSPLAPHSPVLSSHDGRVSLMLVTAAAPPSMRPELVCRHLSALCKR